MNHSTFAYHAPLHALVCLSFCVAALLFQAECFADKAQYQYSTSLFDAMEWRNIGPFRGGRVTAVSGVPGKPYVFYFGGVGGGVWMTENAGGDWHNVSDGFFGTSSVGAIAVAPSDPNVVVVGMGEAPMRGVASSYGDGMYKSTDAGQTWIHCGLEDTWHISSVRIHPANPDIIYVAAQGSTWMPTKERGIYRSLDGCRSWQLVLHVDDRSGASDLAMDATNPRVLYAAFWDHQRTPWQIRSGGPGSSIHKSTDGGQIWNRLDNGLPDQMGKIGIAVSPANPSRVWAMIEANEQQGGLYRSDDAGKSWQRVNNHRALRARAWYYTHVIADPLDEETVYVLAAPMLKSTDGGKTFVRVPTPHGDNHGLWINPSDNRLMINGNDGGANVSLDGGRTWSTQLNQPTAQFFRVIADNRFPYYVYGGQQDNSTIAIASRSFSSGIGQRHWYPVGGGEGAHIAMDADHPRFVYATNNRGRITEFDQESRITRNIMAYPMLGLGADAREYKYRFKWNAPVLVSRHNPEVIYHAGNVVLKSTDRGMNWTAISRDLTRNEAEKQLKGGVPFTNEAAGAEIYNAIMYLAESPHDANTLWAGSDDGLVHVTRDGGKTWTNITPKSLDESQINSLEVSPHQPGAAYITVTRYKFGDVRPMVFKTVDYGERWTAIDDGLPDNGFARMVREDPERRGLLYAGTETGFWVSFDDGGHWQPLQLNLPVTPITDIRVHRGDIVVSTQGRSFWILDNPAPLREIDRSVAASTIHLYRPARAIRLAGSSERGSGPGKNPSDGAVIYFYLKTAPDAEKTPLGLEVLDDAGNVVRHAGTSRDANTECAAANDRTDVYAGLRLAGFKPRQGMNRFVWDLRRENITCVPDLPFALGWGGPRVAPGTYTVRLTMGEISLAQPLTVGGDPRAEVDSQDYREQSEMVVQLYRTVNEVNEAMIRMRVVRQEVLSRVELTRGQDSNSAIREAADALIGKLTAWEDTVVQTRQKTRQDVANFPNQLNANLVDLMQKFDDNLPPPSSGMQERYGDLMERWERAQDELARIFDGDVAACNALLDRNGLPAIYVPPNM